MAGANYTDCISITRAKGDSGHPSGWPAGPLPIKDGVAAVKKAGFLPALLFPLILAAVTCALIGINAHSPRLFPSGGRLAVGPGLKPGAYLLDGAWETGSDGESVYRSLTISVEGLDGWCVFLSDLGHPPLVVDGVEYAEMRALENGVHTVAVRCAKNGDPAVYAVYLAPQEHYHSMKKGIEIQLIFIAGLTFGILLYALSLYCQKRSEGYMLVLALMVYSTLGRSLVYAFPGVGEIPVLQVLLLGPVSFGVLPQSVSIHLNSLFITALLAWLRYRLIRELTPTKISLRLFSLALVLFSLSALPLIGDSGRFEIARLLLESVLYAVEAYCIAGGVYASKGEKYILGAAWTLTVSAWLLTNGSMLGLFPHGVIDRELSLRAIAVLFYEIAFLAVINGKFARKFTEADKLAVRLEQVNEGLEASVWQKTMRLQQSYERIASLKKRRDEFMRGIVHSLKSTLFSTGGYADMAKAELNKGDFSAAGRHLDVINGNVDYARQVIDDLSAALCLEENRSELHMEPFDMEALLLRAKDTALGAAGGQELGITLFVRAKSTVCVGDEYRIRQAVQNVMDNAVRHSRPGGVVEVALDEDAAGHRVSVRDYGEGIAPEDIEHIFEYYYSKQQNSRGSNGLGLTIAKNIMELHSGSISVESELGKGALFTLFLPKKQTRWEDKK